jgi:hypothetical protein
MTKKLMTLLLAMLALMGCKDSKDEPNPNKPPRMYVAISDLFNSYVHDIEGNVIYEGPQESHIIKLASEGKDWYAVRSRRVDYNTVIYEVLKNGTVQFQIPYPAEDMCVENGNVYTYQYNDNNIFIYKNDQLLYKYDTYDCVFVNNSFDVVDGHLVAGISNAWSYPSYWIDGEELMIDIDSYFDHMELEAYAREGTDDLFVIRRNDESIWYQFKGQSHHLPSAYFLSQAMIVDGDSYILALNWDMDQALLYVNGYKYLLNRPLKDDDEYAWWLGMMRRYGNDVYVLTNTWGNHSQIYKRTEPIDMSARIELKNVAGGEERVKPLSDFTIVDFIVLPPK